MVQRHSQVRWLSCKGANHEPRLMGVAISIDPKATWYGNQPIPRPIDWRSLWLLWAGTAAPCGVERWWESVYVGGPKGFEGRLSGMAGMVGKNVFFFLGVGDLTIWEVGKLGDSFFWGVAWEDFLNWSIFGLENVDTSPVENLLWLKPALGSPQQQTLAHGGGQEACEWWVCWSSRAD